LRLLGLGLLGLGLLGLGLLDLGLLDLGLLGLGLRAVVGGRRRRLDFFCHASSRKSQPGPKGSAL
jgi:hypothetical protein